MEVKQRTSNKIHVAIGSKNPCKIDAVKSAFHKVFQKHLNDEKNESNKFELFFSCHNVPSKVKDQPVGDDETLLGAKNRAIGAFEAAQTFYLENSLCADEVTNIDKSQREGGDDENDEDVRIKYGKEDTFYGPPDFGVGLEGGIDIKPNLQNNIGKGNNEEEGKELWCMAWMAIVGTKSSICTLCKHDSSSFLEQTVPSSTTTITTTTLIKEDETKEKEHHPPSPSDLQWGLSKTAAFKLPQKISDLILNENMELGHADDKVFNRVNSKQGSGTVGVLTNNLISRSKYYDHAIVLALISFIWPEHYMN